MDWHHNSNLFENKTQYEVNDKYEIFSLVLHSGHFCDWMEKGKYNITPLNGQIRILCEDSDQYYISKGENIDLKKKFKLQNVSTEPAKVLLIEFFNE